MCKCPSLRLQPIFENTPQSKDPNIHHQMGGIGLSDQCLALEEMPPMTTFHDRILVINSCDFPCCSAKDEGRLGLRQNTIDCTRSYDKRHLRLFLDDPSLQSTFCLSPFKGDNQGKSAFH